MAGRRDGGLVAKRACGDNARMRPPDRSATPPTAWDRYQPWRRLFEVGVLVGLAVLNSVAGSATSLMDARRVGLDVASWEPMVWESSSNLMWLALVPMVAWLTRRIPLHLDTWRRALPWHVAGSVAWSVLHVAGMVGIRKLVYAAQGLHYDFGPWLHWFGYEYLKDARSYAVLVLAIEGYRFVLRRWQGEASVLSVPDNAPPVEPVERPERFLVRKLGKEFLVAAAEVEWLQAAGNYVNLHVRGRDYPLRATMAGIETQFDPSRFVRVHRSYMVNLDRIAQIEPLDTGDARIVMDDGAAIPCSRRYRDALRPALRAA
jgi:hypothetical protein